MYCFITYNCLECRNNSFSFATSAHTPTAEGKPVVLEREGGEIYRHLSNKKIAKFRNFILFLVCFILELQ